MKKTLKKLILILTITINLFGIFAQTTLAKDTKTKKDPTDCYYGIDQSKYIITIVEEALTLDEKKSGDFITKNCFRVYEADPKDATKTASVGSLKNKCPSTAANCDPVQIIMTDKGGLTMLYGYIGYLYKWAAGFVGLIAVAIIIISSAQISLSGGNDDAITSAKDRIIKSLSGLALLFLTSLILYTINPTFFTL